MDKENVPCQRVYYSAIKTGISTLLFGSVEMDYEDIRLNEISQKEKDIYCMILVIYEI